MATTLLKWTRKEFYLSEIKELIEDIDEWNEMYKQN